jgi:peptidoglycan/xylan/chitin deacetylase (PgdA/CDA1 family)
VARIALRIDDIGGSTKQFEVYSKRKIGNFLFLKYLKGFKAWGPYREMSVDEWNEVYKILRRFKAKLTVGITAAWIGRDGSLTPFPEKFSEEAKILKDGLNEGLLEIANHGLTHCVVGKHLPKLFTSNRKYHREFWDWIPREVHFEHLEKSQKIFRQWLGEPPTTLIPPGNVYSIDTLQAAEKYGIKQINSYMDHNIKSRVQIINNDNVDAFHDREIVLEGLEYFNQKLSDYPDDEQFIFVKDL